MNILQIEDDIKSLPDQVLMQSMQTGDYPQYLVISELKRRKDMREDHAGRMASYNKDNTVADKIMNEASMSMMNQGLGGMAPPAMASMKGMPQNTPAMPVGNQGIGQMMPSNMVGMKEGKELPNKGLEALAKVAPEAVENMGYSGGGIVEMFPGQQVPYNINNPLGVGEFYDFYSERMQPTQAELDYQNLVRGYFDPEEQEKRRRSRQGLDLVRAGLAVGTSATPQQLQQSLNPVIEGAAKTLAAADTETMQQAKFEADMAKTNRERDTRIAELAYKSEQARELGDYYKGMRNKDQANIAIAKQLAKSDPQKFAMQIRDKNNPEKITYSDEPNYAAMKESGQIIGAPSITAQRYRTRGELNDAADGWVAGSKGFEYVKKLVEKENMSKEDAAVEAKRFYLENAAMGIYLEDMYGGGQVPALPEDPPMIDMSSRF